MRKSLEKASPAFRYDHLTKLLGIIKKRSVEINLPYSILCYGSGSYGFNPDNPGKLDDLDLFIVIPDNTDVDQFEKLLLELFPEGMQLKKSHLRHLAEAKCELCRLYCRMQETKIGFRVISYRTLESFSSFSGIIHPIRNIASVGQSRIVTDKEWSFATNAYVPVTYESWLEKVEGEEVLTVVHRILSSNGDHLGALGRKLLAAHIVHSAPAHNIITALNALWREFVKVSLHYNPNATNDEIIDSIMRSEKFSLGFRRKLRAKISSVRRR